MNIFEAIKICKMNKNKHNNASYRVYHNTSILKKQHFGKSCKKKKLQKFTDFSE